MSEPTLWDQPTTTLGMVRTDDRETAVLAAETVLPKLNRLRTRVLALIAEAGPDGLTDKELEQLPEFATYAYSTVRKRRTELYQAGYLVEAGVRDRLTVWTVNADRAAS